MISTFRYRCLQVLIHVDYIYMCVCVCRHFNAAYTWWGESGGRGGPYAAAAVSAAAAADASSAVTPPPPAGVLHVSLILVVHVSLWLFDRLEVRRGYGIK